MKTMTCRQLGGACDKVFSAATFAEAAELSKRRGMEMFQKNDVEHLKAIDGMKDLMTNPDAMKKWMESKRQEFERLSEGKYKR